MSGKSPQIFRAGVPLEFVKSMASESEFVPGRRPFFKYRELGVIKGTGGQMRAQITSCGEVGLSAPTGWHYHLCDVQFTYMIKGWVDLEFEDGTRLRQGPGDALLIPGGTIHQEVRTAEVLEVLEISLPADMGTVNCEAPPDAPK